MPEALLVGLDVGTTKAKGALFDLAGRPLATAECAYPMARPRAGWAEQDPEAWWDAVRHVLAGLGDLGAVAAVGVCSQVNTHVFCDAGGRPLAPAISWQDGRCADVARRLDAPLSPADRERIWGGPFTIDASTLVARAAWVREERPEVWERTRYVLSPKDFLNARLCGATAADPISSVGLVDDDGRYLPDVVAMVPGLDRRLPPLAAPTDAVGTVGPAGAPLPARALVVAATMDAWGNLYGSGLVAGGDGMEVAGTSEVLAAVSVAGSGAPGVITFPPVDGVRVHAGPTQAGGDALRWVAALLGHEPAAVVRAAAGVAPGAEGVVFLPHLQGERAPLWDADARGVLVGLRADHGPAPVGRAVLEGVACSARHLLEAIEAAAGAPVPALRASGGAARSDVWCQIKADVLGRPLHRLRVIDSGALGAALLAGVGAGLLPDLAGAAREMVHVERTFAPDERNREGYDALYGVYREAQAALMPVFGSLARLPQTRTA